MSGLPVDWRLPVGWEMKRLGEVATLQRGFDLPVQDRQEGSIKIFAANGPVGTHNEAKVSGPGVVTGRSGSIGKVHYVDEDYWPLNTALWVKDFHANDPRWVARLLTWMQLEQFTRGVGVPTLNRNLVHEVEIPLPPLEEQKRIAGILDQADALRRLRTRALDKLNTLGQAIFHEMFGEAAASGRNWPRYALADLVFDDDRINYGVVQPGDQDSDGVPIIRVADLAAPVIDFAAVKRISKEIDANYARSRLKGGEILIGCVGSIGTTMIAPEEFKGANIARAVARVAVDPKKCDPEFVAEYIRSDLVQRYFQKEVRVVAQPTLNIKQIRETEIVVPPANLQTNFLERLNVIKESTKSAAKGFVEQQSLFTSLQHRAFRGEL
jgi:type I restriction enzyme, S subunit